MVSQRRVLENGNPAHSQGEVYWQIAYIPDYTIHPLDASAFSAPGHRMYGGYIFKRYPDGNIERVCIKHEEAARQVARWLNEPQELRMAHWHLAYMPDYTCCPFDQQPSDEVDPSIYTGCIFCDAGIVCPEHIEIPDEVIAAQVAECLNECTALLVRQRQRVAVLWYEYKIPIVIHSDSP